MPRDFDHKFFEGIAVGIDKLVDVTNEIVSSRLWFAGFIAISMAFMIPQFFLKHPLDDPNQSFPRTVLIYTLLGLWIENSMKVYQREQSVKQTEQALLQTDQINIMLGLVRTNAIELDLLTDTNEKLVAIGESHKKTLKILTHIAESSLLLMEKVLDAVEDTTEEHFPDEPGPLTNPPE